MTKILSRFVFVPVPAAAAALHDYFVGASTAIDILPDHDSYTFVQSDARALFSDWVAVQNDLLTSIHEVTSAHNLVESSHGQPTPAQAAFGLERAHSR